MRRHALRRWLRRVFKEGSAQRTLWKLARNLDRHGATRAASAMAFDAFLSMIPLLALGGYVLGRLHRSEGLSALSWLFRAAPGPVAALADSESLRLSDAGAAALAPVSIGAFLWVGSSGIDTAIAVCETIFAAQRRTWWRRRALAIVCVIVSIIAFPVATVVSIALVTAFGAAGSIVAVVVAAAIVIGVVVTFFRVSIQRPRGVRRRLVPGALVTVALWATVSFLFSAYVRTLARYATLYGSLAAVAMLLFWLWLLALALLVGGEVNAELEGVRNEDEDVPSVLREAAAESVAEGATTRTSTSASTSTSTTTRGDGSGRVRT